MYAVASRDHPQSTLMYDVQYAGVPLGRYRYPLRWFFRRFMPSARVAKARKPAAVLPRDDDKVRAFNALFDALPEESRDEVRTRFIQAIVTFERTNDIEPLVDFARSVLVTAKLNANPRYRAALKDAEAVSWDEPGVSVEEMIKAADERRRAAEGRAL